MSLIPEDPPQVPVLGDAIGRVLARLDDLERGRSQLSPSAAADLTAAIERLRVELGRSQVDGRASDAPVPPSDSVTAVLERLAAHAPRESRYRLDGEIARGGMGAILQAWDSDLRRTLAMKVALGRAGEHAVDAPALARFLEEARITGQLDHPGIVPVHELGLDGTGRVYFTMRLVRGRDLAQVFALARAREEGWTQTRVLGVLLKVCEAMAYAHDKGVVHRDLKPANVMVGRFGEVYVMDWGLAKITGAPDAHDLRPRAGDERLESESPVVTMDGTVLGTPAFMSPEQARGELGRVDARADVYAAGAMLYQLLTGRVPYHGERKADARELWQRLLAGPPEAASAIAPDAPPELVAICERAMARDMELRYPSMLALADDLRAWLEGRVVRAYESGVWPELKKWVLRNKGLATASAAALLAIAGGVLWTGRVEARGREERQLAGDAYIAAYLLDEAERMSIADRQVEPRILAWLSVARDLASREPVHRRRFEERRQVSPADGAMTQVERERAERLVEQLAQLTRPATGMLASIEALLAQALEVRRRSAEAPEARRVWDDAIRAIGDAARSPAYGGLQLTPQFGLLPLGPDPASGLWEFAHLPSGEPPERDASGRLAIGDASGVVLVLVPGGRFWMGEQTTDPAGRHYYADPTPTDNGPPVELELAPFFMSKYELTQAQWLRAAGVNPSKYGPLYAERLPDELGADVATHPVDSLSWVDAARIARDLGLELPTETQWEYAARAGTDTTWWTGDDRDSLVGAANLGDQALMRTQTDSAVGEASAHDWPELDDGFGIHSRVDALKANPFGLHGMVGNLWEWCRDSWGPLFDPARAGDGLRAGRDERQAAVRGGSFEGTAASARSANRAGVSRDQRHHVLGARPARAIDP